MPKCPFCNEPIRWKRTIDNKTIPVELNPVNVVP
jgi:hypothetical protein